MRIAAQGSDPLYEGAIARDIIFAVRTAANPGLLTLDDLDDYEVIERPPVCMSYRTYEVCGMGPPSSGGLTVDQMLGILSHFDLAAMGPGTRPRTCSWRPASSPSPTAASTWPTATS